VSARAGTALHITRKQENGMNPHDFYCCDVNGAGCGHPGPDTGTLFAALQAAADEAGEAQQKTLRLRTGLMYAEAAQRVADRTYERALAALDKQLYPERAKD
jgi:hypothetical protein